MELPSALGAHRKVPHLANVQEKRVAVNASRSFPHLVGEQLTLRIRGCYSRTFTPQKLSVLRAMNGGMLLARYGCDVNSGTDLNIYNVKKLRALPSPSPTHSEAHTLKRHSEMTLTYFYQFYILGIIS